MKMIRTFLTAAALFISFLAAAQNASDTAERTVFWRITGEDIKDTSYLFGTMHPVFREDVHIAGNMLQQLLRSKIIYFEHPVYNTDDSFYIQQNCLEKPHLRRILGGVCYKLVEDHLKLYNDTLLYAPCFQRLSPAYLAVRVIRNIFGNDITSIDATLMAIAMGNDQPVAYLDSEKMEKELRELIPVDEQATQLYYLLSNIEKAQLLYIKQVKDFTSQYYSGNIRYIYNRTTYREFNNPVTGMHITGNALAEKLLDKRNKKWLPVMAVAMKNQPSFFAVGAAHLAGPKGLISLLRRKGFTVTPVLLEYRQE